jgi:peptidoglycan/xylan/chitin deacetylase (PgdA/CDA1 family)
MTFDEIDALTDYEGLEVGIHTVTHPVLPSLPDDELIDEVRSSFEQLRARYSRTIPVLAIPYGLFDDRTLRLASQAGAVASLTLTNRLMGRDSSYGTPRLSMTRHSPIWKQRLRWTGVVQAARDVMGFARRPGRYPALPSAVS